VNTKSLSLSALLVVAGCFSVTPAHAAATSYKAWARWTAWSAVILGHFGRLATKDSDGKEATLEEMVATLKAQIANKEYKAALNTAVIIYDTYFIGFAGKDNYARVDKDTFKISFQDKDPVKPFGVLGTGWAYAKKISSQLEGIDKLMVVLATFKIITTKDVFYSWSGVNAAPVTGTSASSRP
jgi:hypothetical protein